MTTLRKLLTRKGLSMNKSDELYKRAMVLESKLQYYLKTDTYIGKESRAGRTFTEVSSLWKEIHKLELSQVKPKGQGNPYG